MPPATGPEHKPGLNATATFYAALGTTVAKAPSTSPASPAASSFRSSDSGPSRTSKAHLGVNSKKFPLTTLALYSSFKVREAKKADLHRTAPCQLPEASVIKLIWAHALSAMSLTGETSSRMKKSQRRSLKQHASANLSQHRHLRYECPRGTRMHIHLLHRRLEHLDGYSKNCIFVPQMRTLRLCASPADAGSHLHLQCTMPRSLQPANAVSARASVTLTCSSSP